MKSQKSHEGMYKRVSFILHPFNNIGSMYQSVRKRWGRTEQGIEHEMPQTEILDLPMSELVFLLSYLYCSLNRGAGGIVDRILI